MEVAKGVSKVIFILVWVINTYDIIHLNTWFKYYYLSYYNRIKYNSKKCIVISYNHLPNIYIYKNYTIFHNITLNNSKLWIWSYKTYTLWLLHVQYRYILKFILILLLLSNINSFFFFNIDVKGTHNIIKFLLN